MIVRTDEGERRERQERWVGEVERPSEATRKTFGVAGKLSQGYTSTF
jgi:hypothetical protein